MSDLRHEVDSASIERNYQYISDSLVRLIFNKTDLDLSIIDKNHFLSDQQSNYDKETFNRHWLNFLTSYSRSASLLNKNHPIVVALEHYSNRYLTNVVKTAIRAAKKDPEFVFFDGDDDQGRQLFVYRIKPAIFDLVLALFIAIYLTLVYLITANWSVLFNILQRSKALAFFSPSNGKRKSN